MKKLFLILLISTTLIGCSENYSNGERIGVITQFSKAGLIWKSWEGHLNVTQTGMNSSTGFDFSLDNDKEDSEVILSQKLDSAAVNGWKVKLIYHKTSGWNWFSNRGNTDFFINEVIVLDRNFSNTPNNNKQSDQSVCGRTIDTIYVVIDRTVHNSDPKKTFIYAGE